MNAQWVHRVTQRVLPVTDRTYGTCIVIDRTDSTDVVTDCTVRYMYIIRLYAEVHVEI